MLGEPLISKGITMFCLLHQPTLKYQLLPSLSNSPSMITLLKPRSQLLFSIFQHPISVSSFLYDIRNRSGKDSSKEEDPANLSFQNLILPLFFALRFMNLMKNALFLAISNQGLPLVLYLSVFLAWHTLGVVFKLNKVRVIKM